MTGGLSLDGDGEPGGDEPALLVEGILGSRARLPCDREGMSGTGDVGDDREVGLRDELLDLEVASNDEA